MTRQKRILALFCAVLCCFTGAQADELRVDPEQPPAELATIIESVKNRGNTACAFTESRQFPFRKNPVILAGTSSYLPEQGLLLCYTTPNERKFGISGSGIVQTDENGQQTDRELPGRYAAMLSVYDFDLNALAEEFDIYFEGTRDDWTLHLCEDTDTIKATHGPRERNTSTNMSISGDQDRIRKIIMTRQGAISIKIELDTPREMTPEETVQAEKYLHP